MDDNSLAVRARDICDQVYAMFDNQKTLEFSNLIEQLKLPADQRSLIAANCLAEIQAHSGPRAAASKVVNFQ